MEQNHKKYYRAKEVAQMFGIGLTTVWLYARQGKITPKKLSERVTVFDIDEVKEALNLVEVA